MQGQGAKLCDAGLFTVGHVDWKPNLTHATDAVKLTIVSYCLSRMHGFGLLRLAGIANIYGSSCNKLVPCPYLLVFFEQSPEWQILLKLLKVCREPAWYSGILAHAGRQATLGSFRFRASDSSNTAARLCLIPRTYGGVTSAHVGVAQHDPTIFYRERCDNHRRNIDNALGSRKSVKSLALELSCTFIPRIGILARTLQERIPAFVNNPWRRCGHMA